MPAYKGEYEQDVLPFVDAMRYKLSVNRHRGKAWERKTPEELAEWCNREMAELREALDGGNTTEIMLECADIANLAMMVWRVALAKAQQGQASRHDAPTRVELRSVNSTALPGQLSLFDLVSDKREVNG